MSKKINLNQMAMIILTILVILHFFQFFFIAPLSNTGYLNKDIYSIYLTLFRLFFTNSLLIAGFYLPPGFFSKTKKDYLLHAMIWNFSLISMDIISDFFEISSFIGGGIDFSLLLGSNGYWNGIAGSALYFLPLALLLYTSWDSIRAIEKKNRSFILVLCVPLLYYLISITSTYLSYLDVNLFGNSVLLFATLSFVFIVGGYIIFSSPETVSFFFLNYKSLKEQHFPILVIFFILSLSWFLFIFIFLTIPKYSGLTPDSHDYLLIAEQISSGNLLIPKLDTTPHRGILYSILLAPLLYFPGDPILKAQILSLLMASTLVTIIADTTWLIGGKLSAVIAGMISIFTPFLWMQSFLILTDITSLVFVMLSLNYLIRITDDFLSQPRPQELIILGFFIGLAVLARSQNFFLLQIPILIYLVFYLRKINRFLLSNVKKMVIVLFSSTVFSFPILFLKLLYHGNPFHAGVTSNYLFADSNFEAQFRSTVTLETFLNRHGLIGIPSRLLEGIKLFLNDTENLLGIRNIYGGILLFILLICFSIFLTLNLSLKKKNMKLLPLCIYFIINFFFFAWIRPIITVRVTFVPFLGILIIIFSLILCSIFKKLAKIEIRTENHLRLGYKFNESIFLLLVICIPIIMVNHDGLTEMNEKKAEVQSFIDISQFIEKNFDVKILTIATDQATQAHFNNLEIKVRKIFDLDYYLHSNGVENTNHSIIESFIILSNISLLILNWNTSYSTPIHSSDVFEDIYYEKDSFQGFYFTKVFQARNLKILNITYSLT